LGAPALGSAFPKVCKIFCPVSGWTFYIERTTERRRSIVAMSTLNVQSEPKYDLLSAQFFADPHPTFRRMRAEDPVYWHPTLMRRAREQVEIGDHVIQAGQVVFGLVHAGNRDPAHFADAERLDITRTNNHHLGFGYGPHFCVGAAIARLETRIALNTILQRLPGIALVDEPLEWFPSFVVRGVRALPVTFTNG
jgi:cytochrome P450